MFTNNGAMRNLKHEGYIEDYYIIMDNEAIGEGASATVFKGVKKDNGETYAIKIIDMSTLGETELENLHNELKIMSIIDHPNIVRVYAYFECHNVVFIVMEYMSGGELFDRITNKVDCGKVFSEKQAAHIFKQIMYAISYCHSQKICHRDMKAENVLLSKEYKGEGDTYPIPKICDFGFSVKVSSFDAKIVQPGCTIQYAAPELFDISNQKFSLKPINLFFY